VLAVADRVMVLRDGQVQRDGPRDEVLAQLRSARPAVSSLGATHPQAV
jgi:ATP-binding cassette subfamily C exporter for protease/lipase